MKTQVCPSNAQASAFRRPLRPRHQAFTTPGGVVDFNGKQEEEAPNEVDAVFDDLRHAPRRQSPLRRCTYQLCKRSPPRDPRLVLENVSEAKYAYQLPAGYVLSWFSRLSRFHGSHGSHGSHDFKFVTSLTVSRSSCSSRCRGCSKPHQCRNLRGAYPLSTSTLHSTRSERQRSVRKPRTCDEEMLISHLSDNPFRCIPEVLLREPEDDLWRGAHRRE